jgi:hypothetical protein
MWHSFYWGLRVAHADGWGSEYQSIASRGPSADRSLELRNKRAAGQPYGQGLTGATMSAASISAREPPTR